MMKLVFLILFVLSAYTPLFVPDCSACPEITPQVCPEPDTDAIESDAIKVYYQAVHVMCNISNLQSLQRLGILLFDCDQMVKDAYEREWHKLDAPDFEWPLETSGLDNLARNYVK